MKKIKFDNQLILLYKGIIYRLKPTCLGVLHSSFDKILLLIQNMQIVCSKITSLMSLVHWISWASPFIPCGPNRHFLNVQTMFIEYYVCVCAMYCAENFIYFTLNLSLLEN